MDKEFLDKLINLPDKGRLTAYTVKFSGRKETLEVYSVNFSKAWILAAAWAVHTGNGFGIDYVESKRTGNKVPGYAICNDV